MDPRVGQTRGYCEAHPANEAVITKLPGIVETLSPGTKTALTDKAFNGKTGAIRFKVEQAIGQSSRT